MCESCWDAGKKEVLMEQGDCDGFNMRHITLDGLKKALEFEYEETSKEHYNVFQEAITDLPQGKKSTSWHYKNTQITVNFVPLTH